MIDADIEVTIHGDTADNDEIAALMRMAAEDLALFKFGQEFVLQFHAREWGTRGHSIRVRHTICDQSILDVTVLSTVSDLNLGSFYDAAMQHLHDCSVDPSEHDHG